jgi:glucosyl-dolichyl phosphate glucuronosyltransferase
VIRLGSLGGLSTSISVVIITHNRPDDVINTIDSLLRQTIKPLEIIVVDDASNPPFIYKTANSLVKVFNLNPNIGSSRARSYGINVAKGHYIAFMDDDEIAVPNWISSIQKGIDQKADVLGGPILPLYRCTPPLWWSEDDLGYFLGIGNSASRKIWGGNMVFNRNVFKKIGVFDAKLGLRNGKRLKGEDSDIISRAAKAQFKIVFLPEAVVLHLVPLDRLNLSYIFEWAYTSGRSQKTSEGFGKLAPYLFLRAFLTFFNPLSRHGKPGRVKQIAVMLEQIGSVI